MGKGKLTNNDHNDMDNMLKRVLQAYKVGEITEQSVISCLAHIIAAVDINNHEEARKWFQQDGIEYFKETDKLAGRS